MLAAGFGLQLLSWSKGGRGTFGDLPKISLHRGIGPDAFPYIDRVLEYPVGAGLLLYLAALVAPGPFGVLAVTAVGSATICVVITIVLERRVGSSAWRWAAAPLLMLYAFQNWDIFAVAAVIVALFAFERRRDVLAGAALGIGAAIKLFPVVIVPPLVALRWVRGDRSGARRLAASAVAGFAVLNLPVMLASPNGWWWPFAFQSHRAATWGTAWFWIFRFAGVGGAPLANLVSFVAVLGGIGWLTVIVGRRSLQPVAVGGAAVAIFLLSTKVYSPTYDIWLLVFLAILPIGQWIFVSFCVVDLAVFVTVYGYFHGLHSKGTVLMLLPLLVAVRTTILVLVVRSAATPPAIAALPSLDHPVRKLSRLMTSMLVPPLSNGAR